MVTATTSASSSKLAYLKKYQDGNEEVRKSKKRRKKAITDKAGVLVVDEDPIWQKPVIIEEDNDSEDEEKPQVDEDIEVKRMKRLEQLRSRRPFGDISEDGSGWVSISETPKQLHSTDQNSDMSPPRRRRADTPSPEHEVKPSLKPNTDLSPPRKRRAQNYTPSPDPEVMPSGTANVDLSPPRKSRARNDSFSSEPEQRSSNREAADLSPLRQKLKPDQSPLPEHGRKPYTSGSVLKNQHTSGLSPPRRGRVRNDTLSPRSDLEPSETGRTVMDFSPPRRHHRHHMSPSLEPRKRSSHSIAPDSDLSPPRHALQDDSRNSTAADISAPRKVRKDRSVSDEAALTSSGLDLSPPRKMQKEPSISTQRRKTGLVTGRDIKEEISKTKKEEWMRFKEMDPSISGRGAEPVYRDKITGERMSKDQFLKSQKKEEKPKEIKLEWGKGLAQKRETEARLEELERERDKPFARRRDDPELDKMLKERLRWGDPMAHLVKKKQLDPILPDLGDNDKMKESGFIIPQETPNHSWIRRGLDAPPNRYGIKPGRHWDGVDRSNGFEKDIFKRMNEKQATQREAYLWSVSDM